MTSTMDYISLPLCALLRKGSLTVPVKMEASHVQCCCPEINPKDLPEAVDRLTKCKQCTRTRTISKLSDCDSGIVNKTLPFRSRHARTRYVNVCAAVCLLLLVVDLVPQSFAAPRRRSAMEEDQLWGNPCDVVEHRVENVELIYDKTMPTRIEKLLNAALRDIDSYKDFFAKTLVEINSYNDLIADWANYSWMEKWVDPTWFRDEVMPKKMSPEELEAYLTSLAEGNVDEVLPSLHKGLKLVLAAINIVSNSLPPSGPNSPTETLAQKLKGTTTVLRSALCEFTEMMAARRLKVLPLYKNELPSRTDVKEATLVFRDTIDFTQYIAQFMNIMSKK